MGEEALEIIKMAWTQDEVTYDGKFWQFRGHKPFPRPFQKPYPPIWAGCHSRRAHEFAARNGYGCAGNIDTDEDIADKFGLYRKVWGETQPSGTEPRTFLMRQIYVDDTDEKAHEVARQHFGNTWGKNNDGMIYREEHEALGLNSSGYGSDDTPEIRSRIRARAMMAGENGYEWALENGIFIIGSPDTVAMGVQRTAERMGGLDVFCGNFEFGRMSLPLAHRSLQMYGKYVIPALSRL
jgi:alkanesulfonate monooxygenase SsuD/methylene tetrahydromethanopterin reductase-like flavin-dependent oxidoreductase (luciferase family)